MICRFPNQRNRPARRARLLSVEPLEQRQLLAADFGFALAASVGSDFGVGAEAVAVDRDGNVYVTGSFSNTIDLEPDHAQGQLSSAGHEDPFVAKYSSAGSLMWGRSFGGPGVDLARDIAIDPAGGVLVVGGFQGTADFDPGSGTFELTSSGDTSAFVLKLDSDGDFQWARGMTGADSFIETEGVAVSQSGEVFAIGIFDGTVDFDPGTETLELTSRGDLDVFVAKLDAAGAFDWARGMGGDAADFGAAIAVDTDGGVLIAGDYRETADFGPGNGAQVLTAIGARDAFVAKLDTAGTTMWADSIGGVENVSATAVAVDATGAVYTTGSFAGTPDFDPGPGRLPIMAMDTSVFGTDVFVAKLNIDGRFEWARALGGDSPRVEAGWDIAVSSSGDVYVAAEIAGAGGDVQISSFGPAGNLTWQASFAGAGLEAPTGIAASRSGSVFTAGMFSGTTDFDPGNETFELTSPGGAGSSAMFLAQLTQNRIGDRVWQDINQDGQQNLGEAGTGGVVVELFDTADGVIDGNDVSLGTRTTDTSGRFAFEDLAAGDYYLEFRPPAGYVLTESLQGADRELDSDADTTTGRTPVFALDGVHGDTALDAGVIYVGVHPWQNPRDRFDVNDDTHVVPLDVLVIINELQRAGSHPLPVPATGENVPPPFFDVSGDNFIAPIDALQVINFIEAQTSGAEGETALDVDLQPQVLQSRLPISSALTPADPYQSSSRRPAEVDRSGVLLRDNGPDRHDGTAFRQPLSVAPPAKLSNALRIDLHRTRQQTAAATLEALLAEIAPEVALRRTELVGSSS